MVNMACDTALVLLSREERAAKAELSMGNVFVQLGNTLVPSLVDHNDRPRLSSLR